MAANKEIKTIGVLTSGGLKCAESTELTALS